MGRYQLPGGGEEPWGQGSAIPQPGAGLPDRVPGLSTRDLNSDPTPAHSSPCPHPSMDFLCHFTNKERPFQPEKPPALLAPALPPSEGRPLQCGVHESPRPGGLHVGRAGAGSQPPRE